MASVYTILKCHDPGIQKERRQKRWAWGGALPHVGHTGGSTPLVGHVMRNVCTRGATARGRGNGPSLRCIGGSLRQLNARFSCCSFRGLFGPKITQNTHASTERPPAK